jgi:hypothetical protein
MQEEGVPANFDSFIQLESTPQAAAPSTSVPTNSTGNNLEKADNSVPWGRPVLLDPPTADAIAKNSKDVPWFNKPKDGPLVGEENETKKAPQTQSYLNYLRRYYISYCRISIWC